MRKLMLATAAAAGLVAVTAAGASAAPAVGPVANPMLAGQHQMATNVQYDEYHHDGYRRWHHWHHWHHRYWEHGRWYYR
jgi:hypothetical protein